jgi:hypothetical protein
MSPSSMSYFMCSKSHQMFVVTPIWQLSSCFTRRLVTTNGSTLRVHIPPVFVLIDRRIASSFDDTHGAISPTNKNNSITLSRYTPFEMCYQLLKIFDCGHNNASKTIPCDTPSSKCGGVFLRQELDKVKGHCSVSLNHIFTSDSTD